MRHARCIAARYFLCVVVPPRLIPLSLLACALVPAGAVTATAASKHKAKSVRGYTVPCLKADGQTLQYTAKPRSCVVSEEQTVERSLVPVRQLKWKTWTASRAKASGILEGPAYSGKAVVTATKPKRCSASRVIFTRVAVYIPVEGKLGRVAELQATCP